MIDRDQLVSKATNVLWGREAEASEMAESVVDEVFLPALTEYLEEPYQLQMMQVVDTATSKWQAANRRQIEIINRLQAQIATLKEELNQNRTTVSHLEEAVLDPGD